MSVSACLSVSSVRNTAALLSIDCCRAVRMSATRSWPCSDEDVADPADHHLGRVLRQVDVIVVGGVLRGGDTGAAAEHVDVQQRVGAEAVGAVHRHTRAFTRRRTGPG